MSLNAIEKCLNIVFDFSLVLIISYNVYSLQNNPFIDFNKTPNRMFLTFLYIFYKFFYFISIFFKKFFSYEIYV